MLIITVDGNSRSAVKLLYQNPCADSFIKQKVTVVYFQLVGLQVR